MRCVLSIALLIGFAASHADNKGYYMQPAIASSSIVFVAEGDLWQVPMSGGLAHELTSHVAPASTPSISPDGTMIAFTGTYEGPSDVYIMPLQGGLPKRLTFSGQVSASGWTPTGSVMAVTFSRAGLPGPRLIEIDPTTLGQKDVPLDKAAEGTYDSSGKTIYFTRFAFQGSHTKRYKGGTAQSIWKYVSGSPEAVPLTKSFTGTSRNPMWWNGRIYFVSDRDGVMNIWSMNENGGSLRQLTHSTGWDVQAASMRDGHIAYQLGADIHVFDVASDSDRQVDISLTSDFDQTREHFITNPAAYLTALAPSADGSRVVLTARGQVFVAPTEPGRLVDVTRKSAVRYRNGLFMPDGKSVLALSDESGETEWWQFPANGVGDAKQLTRNSKILAMSGSVSPDGKHLAYADKDQELWVHDIETGQTTKVVSCKDGLPSELTWSPDSQWLAYRYPTFTFDRIALYSLSSKQNTLVTTTRSDSFSPAWSSDGKWLYFLSNRTFQTLVGAPWGTRQPEPYFDHQTKIYALALVKGNRFPYVPDDELHIIAPPKQTAQPVKISIDLDALSQRLFEVPVPAGNYASLAAEADRLYFLNSSSRGASDLSYVEISNKDVSVKTFAPAVRSFALTQDGKKLLVARGATVYMVPAAGPQAALDKPIDLSSWTFPVQPREEWRQMFVDAWRLERDYFYDRNMHGVNWDAILAKYLPLVDRVRSREELSDLIAQMVGELSALHTFVYGGDQRSSVDKVPPAALGGLLILDKPAGGYRVTKVFSGDPDYPKALSPLAAPDVHIQPGDVITAVNGVDVLAAPTIDALLRTKAGHQILISVKDKGVGVPRDCIVVPMSAREQFDLAYTDWELTRRNMVESAGKGAVGYVHLRAMGSGDINQWERDFYPVFDRAGLIIDVRNNGGGNIDSWIIEKLLRKAWMYWQDRVGNPYWNMQSAFRGHIVVLCDENTASDGEAFTEGIKRLGLGKVIGTRTWGGEIWLSSSNVLEDFGIATAAENGVYGPEGKWLIEGHGVDPDVEVDNLPHATFLGQDAQLQAALDYLERQIREHPVPVPNPPKHPDKSNHASQH